jgi:hypothetical protein
LRFILHHCSATTKTSRNYEENLNSFTLSRRHNHSACRATEIRKIKLFEMCKLVAFGVDSHREIVNKTIRGADNETILVFGNFETLYRILRRPKKVFNPKPYIYRIEIKSKLIIYFFKRTFLQMWTGK